MTYTKAETEQATITRSVRVCRDCGAIYATPGLTSRHKQATGHTGGFKSVKQTVAKPESVISYQPGMGPR